MCPRAQSWEGAVHESGQPRTLTFWATVFLLPLWDSLFFLYSLVGDKHSSKNKQTNKQTTLQSWNAVKWKGHSGNSFFRFHFLIHKSAGHAHPFLHSLFPVTNLSWRFTNLPYGRVNPFRKTRGYSVPYYTDLT